jgi:hypothetical protein
MLAPIRITFTDTEPFTGTLKVTQRIGNAWRGEATAVREIPITLTGRTDKEEILPIYDFAHPLEVSLLGSTDIPLATQQIDLRPWRRDRAFPLTIGAFPHLLNPEAVSAAQSELPSFWAGYQAVSSLWIGRLERTPSCEQWNAIGQWVLAGGTLVLFTGEDFYRLDTLCLKNLFPLTDLDLQPEEDGLYTLHGKKRPGTEVLLMTEEETPLLLSRRYGTGTVFLVTRSVFALPASDLDWIQTHIPPAQSQLVSLAAPCQDLLARTTLDRPGYPTAFLIVILSLTTLSLATFFTKTTKKRLLWISGATIGLCLLSGLYLNQTKLVKDIYIIKTSICIQDSLGFELNYLDLFATRDTPVNVNIEVRDQEALVQELPVTMQNYCFDISWQQGRGATLFLKKREERTLVSFSSQAPPLSVTQATDALVSIKNGLNRELNHAFLIVDGKAFSLGQIKVGTEQYRIEKSETPFQEASVGDASVNLLYQSLVGYLPLQQDVWLVGGWEYVSRERQTDTWLKVRDVYLYVIRGESYE